MILNLKRLHDNLRYSRVRDSFDSIHRWQSVHYSDYCSQIDSYNDDLSTACRRGDEGAVGQILVQSNAVSDEQLQRLIEVSAAENQVELIKHVLHRIRNTGGSLKPTCNQFDSAAFIAVYRGKLESLTCLLNLDMVSSNVTDSTSRDSLLHTAAAHNQVRIIEEIYKREPGLAKKLNKAGVAPLHVAVANGHQEVTECLLEHTPCSPAMIVSAKGNTALHSACQNNQEAIAEYLITQSTPDFLLARNKRGFLPIHFAATQGNLRLVKMLSEYMERLGVSGNSKGGGAWTPLHCAAEAGHVEVAEYYCSQHSFIPEPCPGDELPHHLLQKYYTYHGVAEVKPIEGGIYEYVEEGVGTSWLEVMHEHQTVQNMLTPLHSAAINGRRSVMNYFLHSGMFWPNMYSCDFICSNSLHLAAYHGHTDCCQLLIDDYNVSLMAKTGSGFTAIDLAAASGNLAVVKYMIETKGYSPRDGDLSPLHIAAYYGKASVISWLLSTGKYDPNALMKCLVFDDIPTVARPLHLAAAREDILNVFKH